MKAAERVAAGLALGGLAVLAHLALNASDGFQEWHSGGLVAGIGIVVAASGAAGVRAGHGHGVNALALGLAVALAGMLVGLAYTLAWDGRTALFVGADLLQSVGAAQAAWFGLLWATRPARGGRALFGLRAGLALLALGYLLDASGNVATGFPLQGVFDLLATAGIGLAASVRGPWAPETVPAPAPPP